ncbi:ECF RNA polymerase sigma factor SigW [Aquisphaera giovannonii]|uniref:ECF RNA polymerase sigma factor SigW n=1 Tax=Aquisphaera giovannonii TaxID=406548 RepID=A0A5B9WES4_9BACT|nr:sigma-70 family RNA polymerase sigma factor [Aquisphaera giovannonii]QEH38724.1 ECF RNA polymerase sigma factor SigW [Aquisphaera giovannonii]
MPDPDSHAPDLIEQAAGGDRAARESLLARYRDHLRRMVAVRLDGRLSRRIDPSDIVQETLMEADRRLDDYLRDRPIPFPAWLRRIAGDRIVDAHRAHVGSRKRSVTREAAAAPLPDESSMALIRRILADDTSPTDRLIRDEDLESVRAAIDSLSPKDREVLVMRHLERLSTSEIGEAIGVGEGAVKVRLLRALIRLRARLGAGP